MDNVPEWTVGSQSIGLAFHFSYYVIIIPITTAIFPRTGPHDRLRLEGAFFVSRFKSLPRQVCFTLPRIGTLPIAPALRSSNLCRRSNPDRPEDIEN